VCSAQEALRRGHLCGLRYETCNHREMESIRSDFPELIHVPESDLHFRPRCPLSSPRAQSRGAERTLQSRVMLSGR